MLVRPGQQVRWYDSAWQWLRARPYAVTALLVLACMAPLLGPLTPCFGTNDDVAMMRIAAGLFSGEGSERLVYSHFFVGILLKSLYGFFGEVNWYTAYLYLAHGSALWLLFYVVFRRSSGWLRYLLLGLLFLKLWLPLLFVITFTTTAFWTAAAACMALTEVGAARKSFPAPKRLELLACCLLVFASLIRLEAMLLAGVVIGPYILMRLANRRHWRGLTPFALAVVLAGSCAWLDHRHYQDNDEWREYVAYNRARQRLHDTPIMWQSKNLREAASAAGWGTEELDMFQLWFFPDESVYSQTRLEALIRELRKQPRPLQGSLQKLWTRIEKTGWQATALFGLIPLVLTTRRKQWLVVAGATLTVSFAIALALVHFVKLPGRVWVPLCDSFILVALFWTAAFSGRTFSVPAFFSWHAFSGAASSRSGRAWPRVARGFVGKAVAFLLLFTLAIQSLDGLRKLPRQSRRNEHRFDELTQLTDQLHHAQQQAGKPVLFVPILGLGLQSVSPVYMSSYLDSLSILPSGWGSHSPFVHAMLRRFEIEDVYRALYTRNDVLLIAREAHLEPFREYVRKHYGVTFYAKSTDLGRGLRLYDITAISELHSSNTSARLN